MSPEQRQDLKEKLAQPMKDRAPKKPRQSREVLEWKGRAPAPVRLRLTPDDVWRNPGSASSSGS